MIVLPPELWSALQARGWDMSRLTTPEREALGCGPLTEWRSVYLTLPRRA